MTWGGHIRSYGRSFGADHRLCALLVGLLALAVPAAAGASTAGIIAPSDPLHPAVSSGWQAGTCKTDTPTCSVATIGQFFEQAAAHPQVGFTQFIVKNQAPGESPVGELKTVRVDLPVGLSVNPGATDRCPLSDFTTNPALLCAGAVVGKSIVTGTVPILGTPIGPLEATVYNIVPEPGEPARFGFNLAGNNIYLRADLDWAGDYHEGFTIDVPPLASLEPLFAGLILKNRLVFNGRAGDGTFITTPSTCRGEAFPWGPAGHVYSTYLLASSVAEEANPAYSFPRDAAPAFESPIPQGTSPKECASIPYQPKIAVAPGTAQTNSPAGATVDVEVKHLLPAESAQDSSVTRVAQVTLPVGMGINPSAANGLQTCDDSQFPIGSSAPITCPPAAKVGRARIESPPLPEGNLEGNVYVGRQLSRDPTSGEEYRIFIAAESARYGISVRLLGRVSADPVTGQLTTTIADTPQVPFSSFELEFDGGARAVLSSPPTCGPNRVTATMTPWAPNPAATPSFAFPLSTAPGGGKCAASMAARAFAPGFALTPKAPTAGAFSPISLHLARPDGQQELKRVDITLPPGLTGKLAGIRYCPPSALAAAAANAGKAEAADPSCPDGSLLGTVAISAGTGPAPLRITGKAFLSGPYRGAPLSLAIVTPATAGPFDLGTVVVRVALFVDPETAQIRALSDPIPDVFGGTQLSLRAVDLKLDRERFTLNPTSCEPLAGGGALGGGGANPADPAAFSSYPVSIPFRATDCGALKFRPRLTTKLIGGRKATRRSGHPKLRAVLTAREGDANIRRAALTLPSSIFLDQGSLNNICTRPRLAAGQCPKSSIYGYAQAETPLLADPLAGPVYLVSSNNELPDLLADLKGQVDIRLRGVISGVGKKGRIRTAFSNVPDVPVSKFTLTMRGGKRGLLENSRNLCAKRQFSLLRLRSQNGKPRNFKRLPLRVPSCSSKGKGKSAKN